MKKLTEEDLQDLNGAFGVASCIGQVAGGMGTIGGLAAALAFGSNPIGWTILGLGAISLAAGFIADPWGCEYDY
ncbi:MAG: hypothetical protein K6G73_11360 [Marinilabiliaceae bacterium]|nr:hypothetical protein [Marinilabiliaceae bacterium]